MAVSQSVHPYPRKCLEQDQRCCVPNPKDSSQRDLGALNPKWQRIHSLGCVCGISRSIRQFHRMVTYPFMERLNVSSSSGALSRDFQRIFSPRASARECCSRQHATSASLSGRTAGPVRVIPLPGGRCLLRPVQRLLWQLLTCVVTLRHFESSPVQARWSRARSGLY